MKRILHVVGRMDRGGTESMLMSMFRTMDRTELMFDFVEQTQDVCDFDEEITALGGKIYRCPHISATNIIEYRKWWRTFLKEHPEYLVVHGHSRGSAPIYIQEANRAGRITVLHCHSNSHGRGLAGLRRYLWQLQLRHMADHCFACSTEAGVSQFGERGNFTVIHNGIQTDKFRFNGETRKRVRSEMGIKDDEYVIGNVARFETPKNHELLIKVFERVKAAEPAAKLMLVGHGTLEEAIRRQVKESGLTDSVMFMGLRSDVCDLLQAMDVFLLTSWFEGLGIAGVEAQAAGLPCVVSATVSREMKLTDNVKYVDINADAGAWAEAVLEYKNRMGERRDTSGEIRKAGYDIAYTTKQLCDFYNEVLTKKNV